MPDLSDPFRILLEPFRILFGMLIDGLMPVWAVLLGIAAVILLVWHRIRPKLKEKNQPLAYAAAAAGMLILMSALIILCFWGMAMMK